MKRISLKQWIEESETCEMRDRAGNRISRWRLNPQNEIEYVREAAEGQTEEVLLKGPLISAEPEALIVALHAVKKRHSVITETFKLSGRWEVDDQNTLLFSVKRSFGTSDLLRLEGSWRSNDRNEILYTYEQRTLKRRQKSVQELLFKGTWDITEDHSLTYSLGIDSDAKFRFKGTFQTESIAAKRGEIRYQLGAEVAGKQKIQILTLFGQWKFSKDFAVSFEVECGGERREIKFGAEYNFDGDRQIAVFLTTRKGESLGLQILFTQEFFDGDGEAFLRFRKSLEESSLEAGIRMRW